MTTTPTLAELLEASIGARCAEIHVAIPGEVVEYDRQTQTAAVRIVVQRPIAHVDTGERVAEAPPVLRNVPVAFPGTGPYSINWPLAAGETGQLIFSEANIGQWQETGETGDPGDLGCHTLDGAVFYPGLRHKRNATSETAETAMVVAGPQVRIGSASASEAAVLGDQLRSWLENHTHPTGTGPSGTPIQAPTLPQTLSEKIKLE